MIALAGAIGSELTRCVFHFFLLFLFCLFFTVQIKHTNDTSLPAGLFLGSGKAIAQAGPLGAFMGYT